MARLVKIDEKISAVHNETKRKIEHGLAEMKSKMSDLTSKIDQKRSAAGSEEEKDPLSVNVNTIVEAMNVELVTSLNEIYQSVDEIDKKVELNKNMLAQNYGELMTIKEHIRLGNLIGNLSAQEEQQQQQQRKERGLDHSRLIGDILSMVRNRLHSDNNSTNASRALPVLGETNSNNGSSTLASDDAKLASQTNKKGGLIFPSVKNKPSKLNTTFTTDLIGYRDVKVSD
jgi:tetrahydromethanopterin S-methyltransferase subunit G